MKFIMTIVMCSYYQGVCLTPYTFPQTYDSMYDCLLDGYQKSLDKTKEIKYIDCIPIALGDISFESTATGTEFVTFAISFRFSYFDLL